MIAFVLVVLLVLFILVILIYYLHDKQKSINNPLLSLLNKRYGTKIEFDDSINNDTISTLLQHRTVRSYKKKNLIQII